MGELTTNIRIPLLRLSEGPNSSSLVAKRSTSPRNGDSPNGIARNMKVCANPEYFNLMVPTLNICPTMDLYLNGARFKLNWLVCKPSIGRKIKKAYILCNINSSLLRRNECSTNIVGVQCLGP